MAKSSRWELHPQPSTRQAAILLHELLEGDLILRSFLTYDALVVKPICAECSSRLTDGPLWCAWCNPSRILCNACMTTDKKGNLLCRRCKQRHEPLPDLRDLHEDIS